MQDASYMLCPRNGETNNVVRYIPGWRRDRGPWELQLLIYPDELITWGRLPEGSKLEKRSRMKRN